MSALLKVVKYILIIPIIFVLLIFLLSVIVENTHTYSNQYQFGVTFTPKYATYLKLDWQKTYLRVLDEMHVKNLRLPSYWDILEKKPGQYDFSETDFMLDQAAKRGAKVVLVVGVRQPRWPECHTPSWAKKLTVTQRQQAILKFMEGVVKKYQSNLSIWAWQVENEAMLGNFGEGCDAPDESFLKSEVNLVKGLDKRPIILTDSGELGGWGIPIRLSDIFAISTYRTVYSPILGYQTYPLTPALYNLKSVLFKSFFGKSNQKTIIAELQAEPWLSDQDSHSSPQKQHQLFSEQDLQKNVEYAKKTGLDTVYLWGVEWWYFMDKQGYPQYLEYAKKLFK